MILQSLNSDWQFRQAGTDEWLPGTVPGGVHTDLLALGRIPDPFVGDNERKVMWVAENDWEYCHSFAASADLLEQDQVRLVCDGLDTIADVYLNGTYLGHSENMFRRWEWQVKPILKADENELRIVFGSPLRYIARRQKQLPLTGVSAGLPGETHLRKASCHFGWDWGPQLPPIGIWKEVRLEGHSSARLENVHIRQQVEGKLATVSAQVQAQTWAGTGTKVVLTITGPGLDSIRAEAELLPPFEEGPHFASLAVEIPDPKLWWPNGYGDQPLYQAEVWLMEGELELERRSYRVGLRTIELVQAADAWGRSFKFVVNGVEVFAKGANWIPADALPTRVTPDLLEKLIGGAAAAHMNMLRVWGGGYYPEEHFFDLCDRYGIMVWQDFMFACGIYPANADFFENVRVEAIENIRRLRHRASLALWCGNNEMEQGWCEWGWDQPHDPVNQRLKDGYDRMFHQLLPGLLESEDPDRPYWPSSASSGTPFTDPNQQVQGDCHYWEVWHGRKPFTAYRQQFPRFMSEFGFQALPPLKTIASYAEPADRNLTSYVMEHHQRSESGNGLMLTQMAESFRLPKDFASLVYLSLVLQAEGIRYGVEHWRRNRQRVGGTLIWQLNDCWPVASWSSLDYFGRWKALHYAARRFYAPLLLSVEDEGRRMAVHLTSDLSEPWEGWLHWRLEQLDGQVLASGEQSIRAGALQDTLVTALDFSAQVTPENRRQVVFICELWQGEARLAGSATPFVPNKHLELRDPGLETEVQVDDKTLLVEVSARSLACFVELELEGTDVIFSDNYFDLPAGSMLTVSCPLPEGWTAGQAKSALKLRSLYQSFA
jgi:beta-mannosidase